MKGLTNGTPEAVGKIDRTLTNGKESVVVSGLKMKDDEVSGETLTEEELEKLGQFSVKKAEELARKISSGTIEASPYVYGSGFGCKYCAFYGVCGQDRKLRTLEYRPLEEKGLEDIVGEPQAADTGEEPGKGSGPADTGEEPGTIEN